MFQSLTVHSHTKSRKGCETCKRRHIRCDENFPQWYVTFVVRPLNAGLENSGMQLTLF